MKYRLGELKRSQKKQAVLLKTKSTVTRFHVLERFGDYTFGRIAIRNKVVPPIRVPHEAHCGHPVAGDGCMDHVKH